VRPLDIQAIGVDLAIKWEDGGESYIPLEALRRRCPCAGCQGEVDVMGHVHRGPAQRLVPASFELTRLLRVGDYAVQPVWADGHATGIYSFEYLKRVAEAP
jgi:DUF971 family protein